MNRTPFKCIQFPVYQPPVEPAATPKKKKRKRSSKKTKLVLLGKIRGVTLYARKA